VGLINTAHLYTSGASEEAVAAALGPFPDNLVVATKGAPIPGTLSLERLQTNLAALDLELSDEDYARLNGGWPRR
jgi:aryl-alcohol dehydrogenase-like predicted oxidoreductase